MATEKQTEANRINSQFSTGPTTEAGKAASSQNSAKHGLASVEINGFRLLPNENVEEYEGLYRRHCHDLEPGNNLEAGLVERMTQHEWLRLRALRLQSECFDLETGHVANVSRFDLYRRYESQHEREYNKTLNTLLKLRAEMRKAEIGFARERRAAELHPIQTELRKITLDRRKQRADRESSSREVDEVAKTSDALVEQAV